MADGHTEQNHLPKLAIFFCVAFFTDYMGGDMVE
jgi:hypothetical protein